MTRRTLIALMALGFGSHAVANDLTTSFEFSDNTGFIQLGTFPRFTGFEGGEAGPAPAGLAHTGSNAWLFQGTARIDVFPSEHVELWFRDEHGGVDSRVFLYDVEGQLVARYLGRPDAWVHVSEGSAARRISRITWSNSNTGLTAIDDFSMCGAATVGTNYCQTAPACFGLPALMGAFGSASVSANDLVLFAGPAQNPGLFQYGLVQLNNPFGNNFVCVGGPGNRVGFSFNFGSNYILAEVDLDAPAFAAFPITPGSTWNFQGWHRDHCGSGASLTDGLEITFTP